MTLAALFALALLTQDVPAPTTDAAAQPEPPAAATETSPVPAAPVAPAEGPVPAGAPTDDYGLVAWCQGALAGHMALYEQVKPALDELSTDASKDEGDRAQMAAGREYLALYGRAIAAAEKANPRGLARRGEAARLKGASIWQPAANAVDPKTRMWSWLMWDLPGRCETAALRLTDRSELLAPALRGAE